MVKIPPKIWEFKFVNTAISSRLHIMLCEIKHDISVCIAIYNPVAGVLYYVICD